MRKENQNVMLKTECHSRKLLSGIGDACRHAEKQRTTCVEDPRLQVSGMTPYLKVRGFTLIELLVVVLIISILAAVALPQYQLAVAKSRYIALLVAGDAIVKSQDAYFLAHGQWATTFNDFDILPAKGKLTNQRRRMEIGDITCFFNGEEGMNCYNGGSSHITSEVLTASNLPTWAFIFASHKKSCVAFTNFHKKVCQAVSGIKLESTTFPAWYLLEK